MDLAELWAIFGPGIAGAIFGAGWWFWVDAVVCSSVKVSFVHYLPGIFASLAAVMFNSVRKEDIDYSPYEEGEWRPVSDHFPQLRCGLGEESFKSALEEAQKVGPLPRPVMLKGWLMGCEERPFFIKGSFSGCEGLPDLGFGPELEGFKSVRARSCSEVVEMGEAEDSSRGEDAGVVCFPGGDRRTSEAFPTSVRAPISDEALIAEVSRLKLWLFFAYVVSFVSLAASVGLLIQDSLEKSGPSVWTGTAGVLQCVLVLISGLIYWTSHSE